MMNHQSNELTERMQISYRIRDLQSNCEHLTKVRDDISERLVRLDDLLDKLIAEKRDNKYNLDLSIDSLLTRPKRGSAYQVAAGYTSSNQTKIPVGNEKFLQDKTNDPSGNVQRDFLPPTCSTPIQDTPREPATEAFKVKLNEYLQDLYPKVDEIANLVDLICERQNND